MVDQLNRREICETAIMVQELGANLTCAGPLLLIHQLVPDWASNTANFDSGPTKKNKKTKAHLDKEHIDHTGSGPAQDSNGTGCM